MKKVATAILLIAWAGAAWAAEPDAKATARSVAAKDGAAVVPLKIIISTKATYEGREMPSQERETEALGLVISKSGLIVSSYFAVDPVNASTAKRPAREIEAEIKHAKLIRKDGSELALKVVLRDADLDLIFLQAEKPEELPHVELGKKAPELGLADSIIIVSRLGAVGDRQVAVSIGHVHSVIEKPRRLYITDTFSLGCPAYNAEGELTGLVVMRLASDGTPGGVLGGLRSQILPAVLPIADVVEDMKQIEP